MSTMFHPLQPAQEAGAISSVEAASESQPGIVLNGLRSTFRLLTALFVSPLLVLLAIVGFFVVLGDFAWFRLRDVRHGHPHPKGLWEF